MSLNKHGRKLRGIMLLCSTTKARSGSDFPIVGVYDAKQDAVHTLSFAEWLDDDCWVSREVVVFGFYYDYRSMQGIANDIETRLSDPLIEAYDSRNLREVLAARILAFDLDLDFTIDASWRQKRSRGGDLKAIWDTALGRKGSRHRVAYDRIPRFVFDCLIDSPKARYDDLEIAEANGIRSMVAAYESGVPVEDIIV